MRLTMAMMATLATMAAGAWASETTPQTANPGSITEERNVSVCVLSNGVTASAIPVIHQAEALASGMYASIGVNLTWHSHNCGRSTTDIMMSFAVDPGANHPGVLAYALPFEGTHIVVFYDRIRRQVSPPHIPTFAAHVLAHEIGHILEGMTRHSETGVMKPKFNRRDQFQMLERPLDFTPADIALIHNGIVERQRRLPATLIANR